MKWIAYQTSFVGSTAFFDCEVDLPRSFRLRLLASFVFTAGKSKLFLLYACCRRSPRETCLLPSARAISAKRSSRAPEGPLTSGMFPLIVIDAIYVDYSPLTPPSLRYSVSICCSDELSS